MEHNATNKTPKFGIYGCDGRGSEIGNARKHAIPGQNFITHTKASGESSEKENTNGRNGFNSRICRVSQETRTPNTWKLYKKK